MKNTLIYLAVTALFVLSSFSANAQTANYPDVKHPEAPVTSVTLFQVEEKDIDQFVADWNTRSAAIGQMPGFMTSILYKSLLPNHAYQLISAAQWQSYDAWVEVHKSPEYSRQHNVDGLGNIPASKIILDFYRPAASYYTFGDKQTGKNEPKLDRVQKDPAISKPEIPFVFINLMEMEQKDVAPFIAEWQSRSQLTRQQLGSMTATLYKTILPDSRYQIINVSQYQSYDAFVDSQNDPAYSRKLEADLNQASSIKLMRGFFRPIAYCAHTYE